MRNSLFLAAALGLGIASVAAAQTAPTGGPTAKGNAPVKHAHTVNDGAAKPGHNSFTEGQARQHILNSGYTAVTGLAKGSDGVWRGRASKGGGPVDVAMDFKGNVTQGSGGMGGGAMHGGAMNVGGMHGAGTHGGAMHGGPAGTGASDGSVMGGSGGTGGRHGAMGHDGGSPHGAMHHGRHHRHHTRSAHRHHHHHHGAVGMSGVDRNDNGISDKEDRAHRH